MAAPSPRQVDRTNSATTKDPLLGKIDTYVTSLTQTYAPKTRKRRNPNKEYLVTQHIIASQYLAGKKTAKE